MGTPVITTKCASLPEVTKGEAIYVDDPYDEREWLKKMFDNKDVVQKPVIFEDYKTENVTRQYLNHFNDFYLKKQ